MVASFHTNTGPRPSNNGLAKFVVQSSDVIQDMRVNVLKENSEEVVWYKERFLGEHEIIEHVVHNRTNSILWTIHRPKRGWYIRIRSPAFPPGVFIPLNPISQDSPFYAEGALSLGTRTNIPIASDQPDDFPQFTLQEDDVASSSASVHSYPPTPTASSPSLALRSPSRSSSAEPSKRKRKVPVKPSSQVTHFVMSPHSSQPVQPVTNSFFARALSALKNHRPSHSNSFTLSRMPAETPLSPPPPYAPDLPGSIDASRSSVVLAPTPEVTLHSPLLVFHDRTPVLTVRSLTGLIEIDLAEEHLLGVETSFWITVALTYLEFLEERESYLAALND